jgi:hypothetical protein
MTILIHAQDRHSLHSSLQQKTLPSSSATKLWNDKKGFFAILVTHLWAILL